MFHHCFAGQRQSVSHQPYEPGAEAEQHLASKGNEDITKLGNSRGKMPETAILDNDQDFQAGKVSECASQWAKITLNFRILSDIRGYKLTFSSLPTQDKPTRFTIFKNRKQFILDEISRLLDKGVIVRATHCEWEFVSQHFRMETFMTTLSLVTPGCAFLSFDFSDISLMQHISTPQEIFKF